MLCSVLLCACYVKESFQESLRQRFFWDGALTSGSDGPTQPAWPFGHVSTVDLYFLNSSRRFKVILFYFSHDPHAAQGWTFAHFTDEMGSFNGDELQSLFDIFKIVSKAEDK